MGEFGVHIILGISVVGGVLSAMLFRRISAPQVIGFIAAGVVLGQTGCNIVSANDIAQLRPFNFFTLGLIGFLVGSEIRITTLRQYGKQFAAILIGEGVLAFLLVGVATGAIVFAISHSLTAAVAVGVVFGAVASATDPASTISVLWEYRCAGVLTTTLTAIVALDDALAMALYGIGTGVAQILTGRSVDMFAEFLTIGWEIFGSIALGVIGGLLSNLILRKSQNQEQVMTAAVGLLLLCIGIAVFEKMDIILVAMSFGVTLVNFAPERSKPYIDLIKRISPPFYVMFFVLVGARLHFTAMPLWLWVLVGAYIVLRSAGKIFGAWAGASMLGAAPAVRRYCGMGLMAQGGVAIGLSVMAAQRLGNVMVAPNVLLADMLIFGITTTTFIVQLIGPPLTRVAVEKAGETGRNITESDIMEKLRASDIAIHDVPQVDSGATLQDVVDAFVKSQADFLPVVDPQGKLSGIIGTLELRGILLEQSVWNWMLAADISIPPADIITPETSVTQALRTLDQLGLDQIPIGSKESGMFEGVFDRRAANQAVRHTLVEHHASVSGSFQNMSASNC